MPRSCRIFLVLGLITAMVMFAGCTSSSTTATTPETVSSTIQSKTVSQNLVTMWHMDEGTGNAILDATTNQNVGFINGATWVTGIKGYALSFNGEDNWVTVMQPFIFHQANDATLTMWINPSDTVHRPVFWTRSDNSDQDRFHIFSGLDNQPRFGLDYRSADGELHDIGVIDVPLNQWTHIAISRSGNDYYFYRNGQLVNQVKDANPSLPAYAGSWYIGRRETGGSLYKGLIDEVSLYNCALSPEEILSIYQE
jgi:hypothetical protein